MNESSFIQQRKRVPQGAPIIPAAWGLATTPSPPRQRYEDSRSIQAGVSGRAEPLSSCDAECLG